MSKALNLLVLIVYFILPIEASAKAAIKDSDYIISVENNEFKVMSYNVQNLFDATHDIDKDDFEFLPVAAPEKSGCKEKVGKRADTCLKLDWTPEKISLKLTQIKQVIAAQGDLPDALVLVEVENPNVVGELAKVLGYDAFKMTTSPDARGIDCAVLYRTNKLTFLDYREQPLEEALYPTRNLSAIIFKLNDDLGGSVFAILPNHWPSAGNPTAARIVAANQSKKLVDELKSKYSDTPFNFVLTGDFNVIAADVPSPISSILQDPNWSNKLIDVRDFAKKKRNSFLSKMPPATYYYGVDKAWNDFDRFLVNAELTDNKGLDVDAKSYRIHAPSFLTKENESKEKIPFRYNHHSSAASYVGYSDHFGIVVKFVYKSK